MENVKIAIIGGGATGAIAACHILELAQKNPSLKFEIDIYETRENLGSGRAYSAEDTALLLNVPAEKMSYSTQKNHDFTNFLKEKHPEVLNSTHYPFVPRSFFREYLHSVLEKLNKTSNAKLNHVRSEATNLAMTQKKWLVTDNTQSKKFDFVFLAQGYKSKLNSAAVLKTNDIDSDRIFSCFDFDKIKKIKPTDSILIIGTGLSAIDIWRMKRATQQKPISIFSRRGLVPLSHQNKSDTKKKFPAWCSLSPRQITSIARFIKRSGYADWPEIADSIRINATQIWGTWSSLEKRQFLKHIKPYWEVIRHRIPKSIEIDLEKDISQNKLELLQGRILKTSINPDGIEVTYQNKRSQESVSRLYDKVIIATGSHIEDTLGNTQWKDVGIEPSEFGIGLINLGAPYLWVLGPQAKAIYWEITAIPEIRQQVESCIQELKGLIVRPRELRWIAQMKVHPHETNESFPLHFRKAIGFSVSLAALSAKAFVHSILPFIYTDDTSNSVRDFGKRISVRREKFLSPSQIRVSPDKE